MELVTKRDMDDAKALGERSGLNMSDDWDEFIHDVAQSIADGRRRQEQATEPRQPKTEPTLSDAEYRAGI